jgi:amidase
VRWVSSVCALELQDAYQLVSQNCRLRIGNLVNPLYSAAAFIHKSCLPDSVNFMDGAHAKFRGRK